VTLALPEGGSVTFEVGEDARNLGQVEVGDTVNAQYTEELSIEVIEDDGSAPAADRAGGMARTAEGRKPGVAVMETDVVTAKVMEINLEDDTFRLGYPDGRVEQYQARNPENLRRAEVGDLVVFTATTSFSLVVD